MLMGHVRSLIDAYLRLNKVMGEIEDKSFIAILAKRGLLKIPEISIYHIWNIPVDSFWLLSFNEIDFFGEKHGEVI